MPDTFRQCASVVLLRPSEVCSADGCDTVYQVLLVHKPRKKDAWQLPQGGMEEGETLEEAALRELREEAGIGAKIIGKSNKVYKYDFPASYRRFRPDSICGQHVGFVIAVPENNAPVTVDQQEIDSHAWALPEQLRLYLKRKEYLSLVHQLVQEGANILAKK